MITGMDRIVAAANGERSDRIPVFCNLFDQGAKALGMSMQEYYSDGGNVAKAQLGMREKYGYDNLWSLFYVGKDVELLGCECIRFPEYGPPNVGDYIIKSHEDIAKLRIPEDITTHPAFRQELKCLNILREEAGGKYMICAYVTSSMALPALLMGMEKWLELLLFGPADVRDALLEKCSDFFQKRFAAYREAGADAFVYSNPFGSTDTIPMKLFKSLSLPWMERDIKAVGTEGVVYYCGSSRFNNVLDLIIERLGIASFYLSPLDDVAEGKKIIAGRGMATGVINDIPLIDWSAQKIRKEVKRIIDAGMAGGRFAFGTIGMPINISEDSIRVMLDAAYEYGAYERNG